MVVMDGKAIWQAGLSLILYILELAKISTILTNAMMTLPSMCFKVIASSFIK